MKKSVIVVIILFVLAMGLSLVSNQPSASNSDLKTVKVGALLPMTGTWKASGTAAEKSLNAALPYVNNYLKDSGIQITLDIHDTQSDPATALTELQSLKQDGINTVIGPMISDEAMQVLAYANDNAMLLLSPSATASELSQPDNFFRMVSTDTSQVVGLTQIIKANYNIKNVISIYVDDTYGRGYDDLIKQTSNSEGINVIGSVSIASDNPNYEAIAASLKELAATADNNTAVVIVAPSLTASELIKKVASDQKLATMKWFASADIIGNQTILKDVQVGDFLVSTGMEGLTLGDKGIALDALPYISSLLDGATDYSPFAITTWDALWLLADTYSQAPDAGFNTLKDNLVSCAANYRNAFGAYNIMDENGDTKGSTYMRYICLKEGNNYTWNCKGHIVNLGTGNPIIKTIEWKIAADAGAVQVGVLLPLTGSHSETGKVIERILNYAVIQFDEYAKSCGSDLELSLVVEDTQSDPEIAKKAAKKLIGMGVQSIIGPINSTELEAVKPLLDETGTIEISPLSTITSLSLKDHLYRLILNDKVEATALSALLKQDGIEKLVIINTNDSYGNDITSLMKQSFSGAVESVAYDPAETDYSTVMSEAGTAVKAGDLSKTAVLAVSYNEIAKLLDSVDETSDLNQVRWYGTDSIARSETILADKKAVAFANKVNFTSIDYSPYGNTFDPLYYVINDEVQTEGLLNESTVSSFDAIWLLGCAYLTNGTAIDVDTLNNYVAANPFHGVGGVLKLDQNGDRQFGYYKFYHLANDGNGGHSWQNDGIYSQDFIKSGVLEMN